MVKLLKLFVLLEFDVYLLCGFELRPDLHFPLVEVRAQVFEVLTELKCSCSVHTRRRVLLRLVSASSSRSSGEWTFEGIRRVVVTITHQSHFRWTLHEAFR